MAVIQDLPPELLRRILELFAADWPFQKDRRNVSLVARAWRHPSQSLLLYHMKVPRLNLTLCTDALRSNAGCTLRVVEVEWYNVREIMGALHEHDVSVETLIVYGAQDSLKSLRLEGHFERHPRIPSDTKLKLTNLTVDAHYLPSPAFFNSILPAAPFLTSLELEVRDGGELLPSEYISPFKSIAHQLRHLTISPGLRTSRPTSRASLQVTSFLASCTSLKSLELCSCGPAYIRDIVSAVRAPLFVLETQLAAGWNAGGTGVAELASVLELPAMANLKRWRMDKYDFDGNLLDQEARARWEAVCRARGAEPRDETRFFTVLCLLLKDEQLIRGS
uniref:F-box domain-containing protein n=1 Tax=Leucosporidium scottii TaxID=5278 RepID=A0A0H5FST4_9BASI|nr:hypothetical protein [Leucosporidium scottii]